MIKPEQIPKEVIEAAALQIFKGRTMPQAIAAALNAWPGVCNEQAVMTSEDDCLILPLPQEVGDE